MTSLYSHRIYQAKYSALPLAILWGLIFATFSGLETRQVLPSWLLSLATAPAALAALMHFRHAYARISWGRKTFKKRYLSQIRKMLHIFPLLARCRSERLKIAIHLGIAAVGFMLIVNYHVYSVFSIALLQVGTAMTAFLRAALPPAAVYLASSGPDRIALFGRLSARCIPGVNALLDVSTHVSPNLDFGTFISRAALALNDCRTSRDEDWTTVARAMIETAPLVLIDGRDSTPGVRFEVERILRNRLDFKVYFLAPGEVFPSLLVALNAKPSHPSGKFNIVDPDVLVEALPEIIRQADEFWVPTYLYD